MLTISPINAFDDNYLWCIKEESTNQAAIVDPGDADAVLEYLQRNALELCAILITHHHNDHIGGIKRLLETYNVPVYGPKSKNILAVTHPLHDGDSLNLFSCDFYISEIPGHTLDHIAYYTTEKVSENKPILFCGDTLFAGGCGRVFEGTYTMMHHSLQKLAALNPDTLLFCAHEYTLANLAFASAVSPKDEHLAKRIHLEKNKRGLNLPTLPSSIAKERESNPFLMCSQDSIRQSAEQYSTHTLSKAEEVFAVLRQWKDTF